MKYYGDLAALRVFSFDDATKIIGNEENTKSYLSRMCKSGNVQRVKRNLYSVIDFYTKADLANQYVISSSITETSFVSYHSAFEFYGFYNQSYTTVQVSSFKRFEDFEYNGCLYRCYTTTSNTQVNTIQGVRVTSIERTIVDSINMLGKVIDVDELIQCVGLIHYIDVDKIKEMLLEYDKDILYRKVGYFLSFFKKAFSIDDEFFDFCKRKSNVKNYGFLSYGEATKLDFISEWGLYAYKDLTKLIGEGKEIVV